MSWKTWKTWTFKRKRTFVRETILYISISTEFDYIFSICMNKICLLWSIFFVKPYCTFQYPQNLIIYLVYVWIKICLLWSILFVHIWPSPQNYFIILLWFNSSWRRFMYFAGYYWVYETEQWRNTKSTIKKLLLLQENILLTLV